METRLFAICCGSAIPTRDFGSSVEATGTKESSTRTATPVKMTKNGT